MQKIALSRIAREEITRAFIFALSFFVFITLGSIGIAEAANTGGLFGEILNKILVTAWDDPTNDGTVKNAESLGGSPASAYVTVGTSRSCAAPQCIYGFDTSGNVQCR